jgi:hypothetical protein
LVGAAVAGALLLAGLLVAPAAVERGGLVAFLIWSSASIGAVALGLIHATTGGRWAVAAAPSFAGAAACLPLAPFAFALLLLALPAVYPWAAHSSAAAPDVAEMYLNAPSYAARGLVALIGWAAIGVFLNVGKLSLLGAALALVFHGVAISLVAVDWGLSIAPHYSDSAFGAELAIQQLMLALALAAILQPARAIAIAGGDVGGLLLTTALAAFYLALMTFIVKWYGDQPVDAAWYLARAHGLWTAFLVGALLFGAIVPIVGCAWERVRASPSALRVMGVSAAVGIFLHSLWLAGPAAPNLTAAAALLAFVAMGCMSIGLAPYFDRWLPPRIVDLRTQERAP